MRRFSDRMFSVVFGALLVLAPDAGAASPAKKAQKTLKKQTMKALHAFEQKLKAAETILDADLDFIEASVSSGQDSGPEALAALFPSLVDYQTSVRAAMNDAGLGLKQALATAITILQDAGITLEDYPKGFRYGDGGTCDRFLHDVLEALDKSLRKSEKRTRKAGKLLEKKANTRLTVRLDRPGNFTEWPGLGIITFSDDAHTIAVAMAGRKLDSPNDGRLFLWGTCHKSDSLILQRITSPGSTVNSPVSVKPDDTWNATFTGLFSNYFELKISFSNTIGGGGYAGISVP